MTLMRLFVLAALLVAVTAGPMPHLKVHKTGLIQGHRKYHAKHGKTNSGPLDSLIFFSKGLNKKKCGASVDVFLDISKRKHAKNWDEALDVTFGTVKGISGILDGWIPGFGSKFGNLFVGILRIAICSKEKKLTTLLRDSPNICHPEFGTKWGWSKLTGKFESYKEIIKFYKLEKIREELDTLLKRSKDGEKWEKTEGSSKFIITTVRSLIELLEREPSKWDKNFLQVIFVKLFTIMGALGNSYHPKFGGYIVDGFAEYLEDVDTKYELGFIQKIKEIKQRITVCNRHTLNETLNKSKDTDFEKEYKTDDDVNNEGDEQGTKDKDYKPAKPNEPKKNENDDDPSSNGGKGGEPSTNESKEHKNGKPEGSRKPERPGKPEGSKKTGNDNDDDTDFKGKKVTEDRGESSTDKIKDKKDKPEGSRKPERPGKPEGSEKTGNDNDDETDSKGKKVTEDRGESFNSNTSEGAERGTPCKNKGNSDGKSRSTDNSETQSQEKKKKSHGSKKIINNNQSESKDFQRYSELKRSQYSENDENLSNNQNDNENGNTVRSSESAYQFNQQESKKSSQRSFRSFQSNSENNDPNESTKEISSSQSSSESASSSRSSYHSSSMQINQKTSFDDDQNE